MIPPNLRPYQKEFTLEVRRALAKHKRVIAQAPTGSGKTKMFIYLAIKALEAGKTVLIIIDSLDIYKQLNDEFPCNEINAANRFVLIIKGRPYLSMAQTLKNRQNLINQFHAMGEDLLTITDEAHIGQATKILKQLPNALLTGFTATPAYQWAKHLPEIYNALVEGPQVSELINDGYLVPCKHFGRQKVNCDGLQMKNGDFTEESNLKVFDVQNVYDILAEDLTNIKYKKCMIFCAGIEQAEHTHAELKKRGFTSVVVHSENNAEENSTLIAMFKKGRIDICINVAKLTKGFDCPPIDLIILLRKTTSLPLFLQMLGRGSRPSPGKLFFTLLDYGDNRTSFGYYSDDRDWQSLWKQKPKKEGVTPTKMCPKCEYICHAAAPICPDCGHVFEKKEKEPEHAETVLVEFNAPINNIRILNAHELSLYARNKNHYAAVREARRREASTPGFLGDFAAHMGFRLSWVQDQLHIMHKAYE